MIVRSVGGYNDYAVIAQHRECCDRTEQSNRRAVWRRLSIDIVCKPLGQKAQFAGNQVRGYAQKSTGDRQYFYWSRAIVGQLFKLTWLVRPNVTVRYEMLIFLEVVVAILDDDDIT